MINTSSQNMQIVNLIIFYLNVSDACFSGNKTVSLMRLENSFCLIF